MLLDTVYHRTDANVPKSVLTCCTAWYQESIEGCRVMWRFWVHRNHSDPMWEFRSSKSTQHVVQNLTWMLRLIYIYIYIYIKSRVWNNFWLFYYHISVIITCSAKKQYEYVCFCIADYSRATVLCGDNSTQQRTAHAIKCRLFVGSRFNNNIEAWRNCAATYMSSSMTIVTIRSVF